MAHWFCLAWSSHFHQVQLVLKFVFLKLEIYHEYTQKAYWLSVLMMYFILILNSISWIKLTAIDVDFTSSVHELVTSTKTPPGGSMGVSKSIFLWTKFHIKYLLLQWNQLYLYSNMQTIFIKWYFSYNKCYAGPLWSFAIHKTPANSQWHHQLHFTGVGVYINKYIWP